MSTGFVKQGCSICIWPMVPQEFCQTSGVNSFEVRCDLVLVFLLKGFPFYARFLIMSEVISLQVLGLKNPFISFECE